MDWSTVEDVGFVEKIQPPRLEDAGLEECALPPDSIMEAFLKAATAVSSRSASADESGEDCVNDASPRGRSSLAPSGALVGIEPEGDAPGPLAAEKGRALVLYEDLDGGSAALKVISAEKGRTVPAAAVKENGGGAALCVNGMRGLTFEGK